MADSKTLGILGGVTGGAIAVALISATAVAKPEVFESPLSIVVCPAIALVTTGAGIYISTKD